LTILGKNHRSQRRPYRERSPKLIFHCESPLGFPQHTRGQSGEITSKKVQGPGAHIDDQQFALISKALADPKRFDILRRIASSREAPTCTCLRDFTGLSPATVSHHLKDLETAGLIRIERSGKFAHLTLRREAWKAYLKRLSAL
jgi:ArsR family transcriptional regulator